MKTLIVRFPGKCKKCGGDIRPGDLINFHGKGNTEHDQCEDDDGERMGEDEAAGLEPGTLANDRRLAEQGLSVIQLSSGAVVTQNRKGRCEDAPCCGCCT